MSLHELGSRLRAAAKQREYYATVSVNGVVQGTVDGDTAPHGVARKSYIIPPVPDTPGDPRAIMITVQDRAGQGLEAQTRCDVNHASPDPWNPSIYSPGPVVQDVHGRDCSFIETKPREHTATFTADDRRIH